MLTDFLNLPRYTQVKARLVARPLLNHKPCWCKTVYSRDEMCVYSQTKEKGPSNSFAAVLEVFNDA